MRAGTGAFPAPCSDRHLQGATGGLLSGFLFFASDSRCQSSFWGRFAAKRDSQPRVNSAHQPASLTRRTVTRTKLIHYSTAREWISLLLRD